MGHSVRLSLIENNDPLSSWMEWIGFLIGRRQSYTFMSFTQLKREQNTPVVNQVLAWIQTFIPKELTLVTLKQCCINGFPSFNTVTITVQSAGEHSNSKDGRKLISLISPCC